MRSVTWAVLWAVVLFPLAAQSETDDGRIDAILEGTTITWDQAAWLVGRSVGVFDESVNLEDAAAKAVQAGWGRVGLHPSDRIDLETFSFLLAKANQLRGGLMYSLLTIPRYAFKELVYRRIIPVGLAPDSPVSGQEAMMYLQNAQRNAEAS